MDGIPLALPIHDVCHCLLFELDHIHDYSDYIVNGQHCALKFSTMSKLKLLISLMQTMNPENAFQLSSQFLISLTIITSMSSGKKT